MLGTAMMAFFGAANAANVKGDGPLTSDYVLKTYITATTEGNLAGFDKIFDDNATFSVVENREVKKLSKEDALNNVKINEGIKQECTTNTSVFKESKENTVYEIDVKYADVTKINYVTMVGSDSTGWKITNVQTVTQ